MAVGGSVRGWQVVSVAILTVALAVAGCGGGRTDRSAPSSTAAAQAPATTSGSGAREVKATVSGRAMVGQCVGPRTDAPTVVLEVGMGAPRDSLFVVEDHLKKRTQVCSYDRAGKGASDPASKPRPVTEVVSDLHAFLAAVNKPPYFLVGHSFGAEVVFLYAQAHSDQVAGFVSINPAPPYQTWLKRARTVETEAEIQEFELPFSQGNNTEGINTTTNESMLTDPLPADLPYAVMFDASCEDLPPPAAEHQGLHPARATVGRDRPRPGQGRPGRPVCLGQRGRPQSPGDPARSRPGHRRSGLEGGSGPMTVSATAQRGGRSASSTPVGEPAPEVRTSVRRAAWGRLARWVPVPG
jgi:pimeloyl-ACP methyl ester carboxylesterase